MWCIVCGEFYEDDEFLPFCSRRCRADSADYHYKHLDDYDDNRPIPDVANHDDDGKDTTNETSPSEIDD